ncbi:MAG: biotin/lipoate A/B protein ligase family protein [Natronomonas sp.]
MDQLDVRLIPEQDCRGAAAMAFDEVAAETVENGGPATVRLYRWTPSTLSLGYRQDVSTVDRAFCEREGIDVTRRPTGGGAIYHDTYGDVAYSIIVPADALPGDVTESYRRLCAPIRDAFSRVGVAVDFAETERAAIHPPSCYLRTVDPAHDLTGPDGRKIAGNAQHRRKDVVVQHGSLTFSVDAETHCRCFTADLDPEQFRERVCGVEEFVDVERAAFVTALEDALSEWAGADATDWTDDERSRADELVEKKYGAETWIGERNDPTG